MPVVKAFLGDPTPPAKLPFCQSTVAAFLNKHSPCLRPIVVPYCQYICHLIASLPPSRKTHRAFFKFWDIISHRWVRCHAGGYCALTPIRKAVLQNALPAMAAMLMVLIYNLADTFFIGQTHDDLQVAAVSLATPVFLLFMSVGTVFGIGGTSVISRALDEGWRDYAKKVCSFCMWCCVAIGVLMSALFLIFMDRILAMIGASAETWDYAKTYLTIVSCSGPFVLIANCYSNVIRAEGQSGKAMMGQLLGNLLNVILDPIMILVFGWNIAGAAIATVIGNVVGAGYYIVYFLKGSSSLSISLKDFSFWQSVFPLPWGIF